MLRERDLILMGVVRSADVSNGNLKITGGFACF